VNKFTARATLTGAVFFLLTACGGGGVSQSDSSEDVISDTINLDFDSTSGDSTSNLEGPTRTPRIVGGTDVTDLRYPWMAAIILLVDF